ncbi:MAG TPA: molybdopterin-dependent oxidoreductase [Tepidisphaeraceae bacterium]|nr:molybdopterin-dependent oxidoreductase [Tepidisphaeraceae bacterium]
MNFQPLAQIANHLGTQFDRRMFLRLSGAVTGGAVLSACNRSQRSKQEAAANGAGQGNAAAEPAASSGPEMARYPEKTDLILLTDRPPQLETPLKYFQTDITPNEAFFVRWHLAVIPLSVDLQKFRLHVGGHVDHEQSFSLDDLKNKFDPVSITAVNQCSGNSRSFFEPRVPGGQWQNGAMGNAKWTGVRLSDLLDKAGLKDGAVDVTFQGLDGPVIPQTPTFVKSLSLDKAKDRDVIVAYAINDQPLPMLNGFPIRLIVPGWFATYWVKSLTEINVLDKKFDGFWMAKAYRVPNDPDASEHPGHLDPDTVPINKMFVRSLIVRPEPGERVAAGQAFEIQGVAFDGGSGISKVEVSTDGGKSWDAAKLGDDLGKYSFRRWRFDWSPTPGSHQIQVRATSNDGQTQSEKPKWNRSGYARNVVEQMDVTVS